jgi:hypothetical protein
VVPDKLDFYLNVEGVPRNWGPELRESAENELPSGWSGAGEQ